MLHFFFIKTGLRDIINFESVDNVRRQTFAIHIPISSPFGSCETKIENDELLKIVQELRKSNEYSRSSKRNVKSNEKYASCLFFFYFFFIYLFFFLLKCNDNDLVLDPRRVSN